MEIIDISLTVTEHIPVWPGDPPVNMERVEQIEQGGNANVSRLDMGVHTGTHLDAPVHFIPGEYGIDRIPLEVLVGPAQVVQMGEEVRVIGRADVQAVGIKPGTERVLFRTTNSELWNQPEHEFRTDFVGIDHEGAEELVSRGVRLVGIDYLSIAPYKQSRPTHEVLLKARMVVIEGLDLRRVSPGDYFLMCLPIKLGGCDGAPCRAVLTR